MVRKRFTIALAAGAAVAVLAATVALAAGKLDDDGVVDSGKDVHGHSHANHGGDGGHLLPTQENVDLVGRMNINQDFPGRVADVGVFGDHAYLGAFNERDCDKGGVYIFDISDPTDPKQINFVGTGNGSYVGEGVQVIEVTTPEFEGDLLIHNNEVCGDKVKSGTVGGVSLVDVTDPKKAELLAAGVGDFTPEGLNGPGVAHEVHSAFAWDVGDEAFAVLVDNEEGADVDILDITDPGNTELIAEYDLDEEFPQIIQSDLGSGSSFLHDMIVKEIGGRQVMLLSYWDGGYVTLDVTNPTDVEYIGDTDFTNPDPEAAESGFTVAPEGNGHQAEFSKDNDFIVAADEDFSPTGATSTNTSDGTEFEETQGSNTPPIGPGDVLEGQTVFVGRACDGDPSVPAAADATIAVVERGLCTFTEKVANVEAAGGYGGVIIFNREGDDGCSDLLNMSVEGGIPALFVGRDTGFGFFDKPYDDAACRDADPQQSDIAVGTAGDSVRVEGFFDGWGYVHLFENGSGKMSELDTYALPEAHDPAFSTGFGDLTVHEVAMSHELNDLAYFAYYSGGFRVARIAGDELVETGRFIAPEGNNFWGVQVWDHDGKELVLASDRDFGVYIFEYTGPGAAN